MATSDDTLNVLGDAVVVTEPLLDRPGPRILFVNEAFSDLFGYRAEEVLGQTPRMFQGPKTERAVLERLREDCMAGRQFRGQTWNYRKDGAPFLLQWSITPVYGADGRIGQYIAVERDVTHEHRSDEDLVRKGAMLSVVMGSTQAAPPEPARPSFSSILDDTVREVSEVAGLTSREKEVLSLLVLGRNKDDCATVLGITPRTAVFHQRNVYRKLGADSRGDLIRALMVWSERLEAA